MSPDYPDSLVSLHEPSGHDNAWFALRVKPKFEQSVSTSLRGRGYEDFLPLYQDRRRWNDRTKTLELPLFPGYLFCQFNPQRRLPILTTPGVMHIVGLGKTPIPVPETEIDAVRRMVNSASAASPWPRLVEGERVLIDQGPLAGIEGLLARVQNECWVVVSISLLQRSVAVKIKADWVRPAGPAQHPLAGIALALSASASGERASGRPQ